MDFIFFYFFFKTAGNIGYNLSFKYYQNVLKGTSKKMKIWANLSYKLKLDTNVFIL